MESFSCQPGFCPRCGTILPSPKIKGNIKCYNCSNVFEPDVFGDQEIEYTLHFNNYDAKQLIKTEQQTDASTADGPVVERTCPKCAHNKMSYATLQLRSADEGQTVFFTCLKCKFKESENS